MDETKIWRIIETGFHSEPAFFAPLSTETERSQTEYYLKNDACMYVCVLCAVVRRVDTIAPKPIEFNAKFPQLFINITGKLLVSRALMRQRSHCPLILARRAGEANRNIVWTIEKGKTSNRMENITWQQQVHCCAHCVAILPSVSEHRSKSAECDSVVEPPSFLFLRTHLSFACIKCKWMVNMFVVHCVRFALSFLLSTSLFSIYKIHIQ